MRAASKQVSTWVLVSSGEHSVATHLRETMSSTAITARRARVKWVKSNAQIRFGFHSNQSGHGFFSGLPRRRPWQGEALTCKNTTNGGLGNVHQVQACAAVSKLAVRPFDATPGLEDIQDRLDLGHEDAVHRAPAR